MEVTLFTDSVKCASCGELDMTHGLKKKNDRWYCRGCVAKHFSVV